MSERITMSQGEKNGKNRIISRFWYEKRTEAESNCVQTTSFLKICYDLTDLTALSV
jgi:hypothetical protein